MAVETLITTASGVVTTYFPLPTAWPSAGADCASAILQAFDGEFVAWDPAYAAQGINTSLKTCWPSQAASWWGQTRNALSTTILGPSFACPGAYRGVLTSPVDGRTTRTFCCPSGYGLHAGEFAAAPFPSQCTSTLTAGGTMSWRRPARSGTTGTWSWAPASTTVGAGTLTVYGVPVNGLNVAAAGPSAPAGPTTTSSSSSSTTSTAAPVSSSSSGAGNSFVGVAVGASVGAVTGVILLALGAFLLWRWTRRRPGAREWDAWKRKAARPSEAESAAAAAAAARAREHVERLERQALHRRGPPVEIGTSTHLERCELSVSPDDGPGREIRAQNVMHASRQSHEEG